MGWTFTRNLTVRLWPHYSFTWIHQHFLLLTSFVKFIRILMRWKLGIIFHSQEDSKTLPLFLSLLYLETPPNYFSNIKNSYVVELNWMHWETKIEKYIIWIDQKSFVHIFDVEVYLWFFSKVFTIIWIKTGFQINAFINPQTPKF